MSNQRTGERNRVTRSQPLVIFPGALGDLVCFLPALGAIAARFGARPALIAKAALGPLARAAGVADPLPIEGREAAWLFSARPPREADDFFRAFVAIECFTGAGDTEVEANVRRWQGENGRVHPFRPAVARHLAAHFLGCVGAGAEPLPEVALAVPHAVRNRVRQKFGSLLNRRPLLVVHPGSGGVAKRWSREGFARLAESWMSERGGALVVLGPAESAEIAFWEARELPRVMAPDLVDLAGLLASCDAYLGNDSGVSHLAAAAGARGIALFGPTEPDLWRPLSAKLCALRPRSWTKLDEPPAEETISSVNRELMRVIAESLP